MLNFLQSYGIWGLFLGSFLAATVVPFSSDALYAAILALSKNPVGCLIFATLGNWLGGLTSYIIGWFGKWEWIEKWFHISHVKIARQHFRINRYGAYLALFSWVPFIGDIFAIALGFFRIAPFKSAIFMLIGKFVRFFMWTIIMGYLF